MKDKYPGISVVVPTHNRARLVGMMLASLQKARENFDGPSEILIIDDSNPEQSKQIQSSCKEYNALYLTGSSNVRQKRNFGIKESQYPIILFVDSDIEATEDLFEQNARYYVDLDEELGGVIGVTEFTGKDSFMWNVISRTQYLNAFSFAKRMKYAPWATCSNTSYKRSLLVALGGFDETFPFKLGADDTDLGIRANNAGYKLYCNPDSVVYHTRDTWNSFSAIARRAIRWGKMDVHLYYRKHNDRIITGSPKFLHIFILITLFSLLSMSIGVGSLVIFLPFLWAVIALLFQAAGSSISKGEGFRSVIYEFVADLLGLSFEMGTLWEGIKRGELAVLYKNIQRGPVLPAFSGPKGAIQSWSMWLAFLLSILIIFYVLS